MRHDCLNISVVGLLSAVVQPKCIAREHDTSAVVIAEHGVRPVQVGSHDELYLMTLQGWDEGWDTHPCRLDSSVKTLQG
jgi:hypothetical protein